MAEPTINIQDEAELLAQSDQDDPNLDPKDVAEAE